MLKKVLSGLFVKNANGGPAEAAVPALAPPRPPDTDEAAPPGNAAAEKWRDDLLVRFYECMHRKETDNFDQERFAGQDPAVFQIDAPVTHLKFFFANFSDLFEARIRLADDASRELLDRLLLYRMLRHHHVRVLDDAAEHWRLREQAKATQVGPAGETGVLGRFGIFELPFEGERIRLTAWFMNVAASFFIKQYYFDRGGVSVRPRPGDHLIDAGACFGDTALAFAASAGAAGRVYAFDMVPTHCRIIQRNLDMNPSLAGRITLLPCGLSSFDRDAGVAPVEDVGINPAAQLNLDNYPVRRIDSLVDEGIIKRVDFIKMDIEGSELDALCGAEESLKRWRPRLAISIYHRPEDFFSIIRYLAWLDLGYSFFIDHYTIHTEETVLYATAEDVAGN